MSRGKSYTKSPLDKPPKHTQGSVTILTDDAEVFGQLLEETLFCFSVGVPQHVDSIKRQDSSQGAQFPNGTGPAKWQRYDIDKKRVREVRRSN